MVIRYLNNQKEITEIDAQYNKFLIPGEYIIYPSVIRVTTETDSQKSFFDNILDNPLKTATFYHEFQHYLSFLGTTYGHFEFMIHTGIRGKFFEEDGLARSIGRDIIKMPRPITHYILRNRQKFSKKIQQNTLIIARNIRLMNLLRGFKHTSGIYDLDHTWPFSNEYFPYVKVAPRFAIRGPHSRSISASMAFGSHSIHEGAARSTEFISMRDKEISKEAFMIREEQPYYQQSRAELYGILDYLKTKTDSYQKHLWHSLVCDLSLMGFNLYDAANHPHKNDYIKLKWEDIQPGWRFRNLSVAVARIVSNGAKWDRDNFCRNQYIDFANTLCKQLNWPSYSSLIDIGEEQIKEYTSGLKINDQVNNIPNSSYYPRIIKRIWKYKRKYPHLIFNPLIIDSENNNKKFIKKLRPHILMSKGHIAMYTDKLSSFELFILLHQYSIIEQLLSDNNSKNIRCYQKYFNFECPQSNGRCGIIPSNKTPYNCPFIT